MADTERAKVARQARVRGIAGSVVPLVGTLVLPFLIIKGTDPSGSVVLWILYGLLAASALVWVLARPGIHWRWPVQRSDMVRRNAIADDIRDCTAEFTGLLRERSQLSSPPRLERTGDWQKRCHGGEEYQDETVALFIRHYRPRLYAALRRARAENVRLDVMFTLVREASSVEGLWKLNDVAGIAEGVLRGDKEPDALIADPALELDAAGREHRAGHPR